MKVRSVSHAKNVDLIIAKMVGEYFASHVVTDVISVWALNASNVGEMGLITAKILVEYFANHVALVVTTATPLWVIRATIVEDVVSITAQVVVEYFANHVVTVVWSARVHNVGFAKYDVLIIAITIVVFIARRAVTAVMIVCIPLQIHQTIHPLLLR